MNAKTVSCPLGTKCPDSGQHIPNSKRFKEHKQRAENPGALRDMANLAQFDPRSSLKRETVQVYDTALSEIGDYDEIDGRELGFDPFDGPTVMVNGAHSLDRDNAAYATVTSYEDHLERESVQDAIDAGLIEVEEAVQLADEDEHEQFWLSDSGLRAAKNVIAEEYIRIGGNPEYADLIDVESDPSSDYANIEATIPFPRSAEGSTVGEATEEYLQPLHAAVANVTDRGSFGARYLYDAITEKQYQQDEEE